MNKKNQTVDLSDLIISKDEALDILGDLLGTSPADTGLFGDKPVKISKPRPQWRIDGAVIVTNSCTCRTCGYAHKMLNPKVMASMSYVDADGRVLKSVKTSDYNLLLEIKGGPYHGKASAPSAIDVDNFLVEITYEEIIIDNIDFCQHCLTGDASSTPMSVVRLALHNQQISALRKKEADSAPNKEFKDRLHLERAEAAERKLMDLIDSLDKDA